MSNVSFNWIRRVAMPALTVSIALMASRAYYAGGYYSTGGDDYLGAFPGSYTWVKETSEGVFEKGQCQ